MKDMSSVYSGKPSVTVERVTGWDLVLDAARNTVGKDICGKEPSSDFKARITLARHSPIQAAQFRIVFYNLKSWVSVHFVRHFTGVTHFVQSQRDDRNEWRDVSRDEIPQSAPVKHMMLINAQEILYISQRRLCMQASKETREAWKMVVDKLREIGEVELSDLCHPPCWWYGGRCPEMKPCGLCRPFSVEEQNMTWKKELWDNRLK